MRFRFFIAFALTILFGTLNAQTPSPVTSTVSVSPGTIPVNGLAQINVQIKDASGNNILTGGANITFNSPSSGSIGSVTDNGNGTYSATYTAAASAGSVVIRPILGGINFSNTTTVTVVVKQLLKANQAGTSVNSTSYSTTNGLALDLGLDVDFLIVGAGGGGGGGVNEAWTGGGGGGGGGIVHFGSAAIEFGTYPVVVGSGGIAGSASTAGGSGGSSSVFLRTAAGGAGGGAGGKALPQADLAGDGANSGRTDGTTSTTTTGGSSVWEGAGGGAGAGGNGSNGIDLPNQGGIGGSGGAGITSGITGTSTEYAAGGGGGGSWDGSGSANSDGGGGDGGTGGGGTGSKLPGTVATNGTNGLGGGGGYTNGTASVAGGAGGSGVVIIKYQGQDIASGGTETGFTESGLSYRVHRFTSADNFSLTQTDSYLRNQTANYSGVLSGTGVFVYNNLGTLNLTANNTYTGGTIINSGVLKISGTLANNVSNLMSVNENASLILNRDDIFVNHSGNPVVPITINHGGVLKNGGNIFNALGPVRLIGGTLESTGVVSSTGVSFAFKKNITVDGNTTSTIIGNGFALGSAEVISTTIDVSDGTAGTDLLVSGRLIDGPAIAWPSSQSCSLIKTGVGKMSVTNANTYTGSTTVSAGILNIQHAQGTGTTDGGVTVASGAALELEGSITVGAEALTINNTGISTGGALRNVSGNNTWGGTVTLGAASRINSDAGTLTLNAGNAITGSNINLTIGGAGNTTVSGTITIGSGTLTKDGNGTLTLTGANTYTGTTTVSAGTLVFNKSGGTTIPATNNVTVSGGTLRISSNQTLNNVTVSSGTLIVDNGVTLTIEGAYTGGGTIDNAGTMVVKGSSSFPGSSTTVTSMSNLEINRSAGVTLDKSLTVSGTLTLTAGKLSLGSNDLTLAGSITGSNSSRYIATNGTGKVAKSLVNNTPFEFPVGNTSYNPITLTNKTGSTDDFSVRVVDEVYSDGSSSGSTESLTRVKRTWDITKSNSSANSGNGVDLVFNWDPATHTSGALGIPAMYHYESGSWVKKSTSGNTVYNKTAGTLTFTGYTGSFSPFAVMDDLQALPVTWLSFSGKAVQGTVELNWSTATEQNNGHFEIERSADARQFSMLGRVNASANPRVRNDYRYWDADPLQGKSFYRLKQVDLDGRFSYSSIIQINGMPVTGIRAWSVRGSNTITVNIPSSVDGGADVIVYDGLGRVLQRRLVLPGRTEISVGSVLTGGMYFIRVQKGGTVLYASQLIQ